MHPLGMSILISHPDRLSIDEQIPLFARVGFDSVFLSSGVTDDFASIPRWAALARAWGIRPEAVHAPSGGMNAVWSEDSEAADAYLHGIRHIIDLCAAGAVDKLVMHVSTRSAPPPTPSGLARYDALGTYAKEKGVHLCFENGDTTLHLRAVLAAADPFHGFCYDTGHCLCYTPEEDLPADLGHRLLYTHIHDNMGPGHGDMHLMPFDGVLPFDTLAADLATLGYKGTLNLELACHSQPAYGTIPYPDFVKEAYNRICRLRQMTER